VMITSLRMDNEKSLETYIIEAVRCHDHFIS